MAALKGPMDQELFDEEEMEVVEAEIKVDALDNWVYLAGAPPAGAEVSLFQSWSSFILISFTQ